jgi:hypothetical protein
MSNYDPRYAFVTCSKCGQKWQRIDYGCARHALTCSKNYAPFPSQVEPQQTYQLSNFVGWYKYKSDAVKRAAELNRKAN